MASTGAPMTPYAPPETGEDWPAQVADQIVGVVGTVRDKTTGPLLGVARAIVYGTFVLVIGSAALVLLVVMLVRLVDNYLPDEVFGEDHIWATYLILGLLFSVAGLVLWGRRKSGPAMVAREHSTADGR
jgi:hypothetical protein